MRSARLQKNAYHHGNLAETLRTLALQQVRVAGHQAISLRELALAAGVTVGAVYRHYADRNALLAAVAAQGFDLFAQRARRNAARRSGRARLMAIGRAYVAFASHEPHLFQLMFSPLGVQCRRSGGGSNGGAFDQLRAALADLGDTTPEDVDPGLLAHAWAVAHGAAALVGSGVWAPDDPRALAAISQFADFAEGAAKPS